MSEYVCSNCGSDRIGPVQRGIDNWPVAQCHECGPKTTLIPEAEGAKRDKALRSAAVKPIGSKKAIHAVLRPVVLRTEYRPKTKVEEAPTMGMFGD